MRKVQNQLDFTMYIFFSILALLILVDFSLPGKIINDNIVDVQKDRQQYYNAARNHHYSYKIITKHHEFLIKEDFIEVGLDNTKIEYAISPIFKEVNWYRIPTLQVKSSHSLRIISGLLIPLLYILSLFLSARFKWSNSILMFVLQVLLITDLIFLLY